MISLDLMYSVHLLYRMGYPYMPQHHLYGQPGAPAPRPVPQQPPRPPPPKPDPVQKYCQYPIPGRGQQHIFATR